MSAWPNWILDFDLEPPSQPQQRSDGGCHLQGDAAVEKASAGATLLGPV